MDQFDCLKSFHSFEIFVWSLYVMSDVLRVSAKEIRLVVEEVALAWAVQTLANWLGSFERKSSQKWQYLKNGICDLPVFIFLLRGQLSSLPVYFVEKSPINIQSTVQMHQSIE